MFGMESMWISRFLVRRHYSISSHCLFQRHCDWSKEFFHVMFAWSTRHVVLREGFQLEMEHWAKDLVSREMHDHEQTRGYSLDRPMLDHDNRSLNHLRIYRCIVDFLEWSVQCDMKRDRGWETLIFAGYTCLWRPSATICTVIFFRTHRKNNLNEKLKREAE